MARRRRAEIRSLEPDLVYTDTTVTAFINKMMRDGKKNQASRIFYGACRLVQDRSGQEPHKVFRQAIDNVKPRTEVKSRRSRSVRGGPSRCRCAGWWPPPTHGPSGPLSNGWQESCWTLLPVVAAPSRNVKMSSGWPKQTEPTPTIGGDVWQPRPVC